MWEYIADQEWCSISEAKWLYGAVTDEDEVERWTEEHRPWNECLEILRERRRAAELSE